VCCTKFYSENVKGRDDAEDLDINAGGFNYLCNSLIRFQTALLSLVQSVLPATEQVLLGETSYARSTYDFLT
jgi:hypothetical protein